jgi:hypothetical protein
LREHADASTFRLLDVGRNIAPEEKQHRYALLDACFHLAARQQRKEETYPEGFRRTSARLANLLANGARRKATHAEKSQASSFGDSCCELGSCVAASERRREDRVIDGEIAAETSLQHVAYQARTAKRQCGFACKEIFNRMLESATEAPAQSEASGGNLDILHRA